MPPEAAHADVVPATVLALAGLLVLVVVLPMVLPPLINIWIWWINLAGTGPLVPEPLHVFGIW